MAQNVGPWTDFTTRTADIPGGDVDEGLTPIQRLRGYSRLNYDANTGTSASTNDVADHTVNVDAQCQNRQSQAIADLITYGWGLDDRATTLETASADYEDRIAALEAGGVVDSSLYVNLLDYVCPSTADSWAALTAYAVGDWVTNGGNVYHCITAGTSASSGGPTTTSLNITDGTAHWRYCGAGTGRVAGTTDDVTAMERAIAAANGAGALFRGVLVPGGSYRHARAAYVYQYNSGEIRGLGMPSITFMSADTSLVANGTYDTSAQHRACFYFKDCDNLRVDGLAGIGDSVETDVSVNQGPMFSCLTCTFTTVTHCKLTYGAALFQEVPNNALTSNYGSFVGWCETYYPRVNSIIGSYGTFFKCYFEQSLDTSYDRVGTDGSSHFIYCHAGSGHHVTINDCVFKHCRKNAIKVSGTSFKWDGMRVVNCKFYNNYEAAIFFGADDVQEHNTLNVSGCEFYDCPTAVYTNGCRNICVVGNSVYYTCEPGANVFDFTQYVATTNQPVEDVLFANNTISQQRTATAWAASTAYHLNQMRSNGGNTYVCTASGTSASSGGPTGTGTGITDGTCTWDYVRAGTTLDQAAFYGLNCTRVGTGVASGWATSLRIMGNVFAGCTRGIATQDCVHPIVDGNTFNGVDVVWDMSGDRAPVFTADNHVINVRFTGPHIRMGTSTTRPTWPCIAQIAGHGQYGSTYPKTMIGESTTALRWPLLGYRGFMEDTASHPEVVIAYGPNASWTNGDTVKINGVTVATRGSGGTGAGQFTTPAELITVINAYGGGTYTATNIQAYNYAGGGGVDTNHIRIALTATSTTVNLFYVTTSCSSPLVGVVLPNSTLGVGRSYSRGEGTNRAVIWSPRAPEVGCPVPMPRNAAAATAGLPYRVVATSGQDTQACVDLAWSSLGGTEEWEWTL